jgi:hypothetical protein
MPLNLARIREHLQNFDFRKLFVEQLGWSHPPRREPLCFPLKDTECQARPVAELGGAIVFEVHADNGHIPDAKARLSLHREIANHHHEHLLIFVDRQRTQSLWYWVKREDGKPRPRDHYFFKGQPGDLFLGKLSQMVFDLADFDQEGKVGIVQVARRLQAALDVERVTKKFFRDFQDQHLAFLEHIQGIPDDRQRRWYASVLLNRLMFIYFLQKKPPGFLDGGNLNYLRDKLAQSQSRGQDRFYSEFLRALFFEGFAKPEDKRSPQARQLLGKIRYLNGGLFLPHPVEQQNPKIAVPDVAFENLFDLFDRYTWHLDDTPGGQDDEINPDVLGYIFEKYINQKAFGAYYTRTEITEYLCERTIHQLILDAINTPEAVQKHPLPGVKIRKYASLGDLLLDLDADLCRRLVHDVLPSLSLLDPACGSGAFLVAAMKTLISVYSAVIGKIKFLGNNNLTRWLADIEKNHPNVAYFTKKRIITDNLFGVDLMEEAAEICKLRLFLALVASARSPDDLEPLPNIDFNILTGNSLVGLMRVDDAAFQQHAGRTLFRKSYRDVLEEKNRLLDTYRHATDYADDLAALRDDIAQRRQQAYDVLDEILLEEFKGLGIKFEQATWDDAKNQEGKPKKRPLTFEDIQALKPFHWGYEFDVVLNQRGGFDAIITNPPWEIVKPNAKEFFEDHSELVTKKKMTIKEFEKEQAKLLKDKDIRAAWLDYLSAYPHVSAYFRSSSLFKNQISLVGGKKAGTDINTYKLFLEQCFNLLRPGGLCGIVIPSGIYTDLGAKQLREMLFTQTRVTALFGFENRKEIFEGVHRSFKFVVLAFQKGGTTASFPAAFMRHDVAELEHFPQRGAIPIPVELVRRLSPDSLSVMEFKCDRDVAIAEKMLRFPLLGEKLPDRWNVRFTAEFHMTNDSRLFHTSPGKGRLPLYEGKMIWQFDHRLAPPRYWVDEKQGRKALLGREKDTGQKLDYQAYRLGFRDIASNTNERTLVSSLVPPAFHGNKIPTVCIFDDGKRIIDDNVQIFLCACWNSFTLDWMIRQKVTTTLNFFYMLQLPIPRLTAADAAFGPIVERAARLICTTPEFDDLAKEVGLRSHKQGATDPAERAKLRAELDGLVAHLYGLTHDEFAYILTTFPLVAQEVKDAALEAYRAVDKGQVR